MADTQAVKQLIDKYMEAYTQRSIDALGETVSKDAEFIAYGTDEGEAWHGWEDYKNCTEKLFGAIKELHWERGEPHLRFSKDGNVCWFAEKLSGKFVTGGEEHECAFRITGIAEMQGGRWVIVQFHRSVPAHPHAVPYLETHGVRFD